MAKLNEEALAYEPEQTKNIADLEVVIVADVEVEDRSGIDKKGKEFEYKVIVVDDEDYRVPNSVLKALRAILEAKPDLKAINVTKTGEGFNTDYTVIPL